jgi:hypothetical protein
MVLRVEFCRGYAGDEGFAFRVMGDQEWEKVQAVARANGWRPERADYTPAGDWGPSRRSARPMAQRWPQPSGEQVK